MKEEKVQTPFEFKIPVLDELKQGLDELRQEVQALKTWLHPQQEWYSLKDASNLKGIPYGSLTARPYLKPNRGMPDGIIGGKAKWRHSTILKWIAQTDEDLEKTKKTE